MRPVSRCSSPHCSRGHFSVFLKRTQSDLSSQCQAQPYQKTLEKSSPKKLQVDNVEMKGVDQDKTLDMLLVVKLSEHATIPTRGSPLAAGYDLYSAQDTNIPARGKGLVKTDIQIRVPRGTYGRVAPRSGLAWKQHIDIGAGVVDEDYRGNVGVVMFNHADQVFKVKKGDRIAQLVCEKIAYPEIHEMKTLDNTDRGEGGFGSTETN